MFCQNCGTSLNSESKFCQSCGTPVPVQNQLNTPPQPEDPVTPPTYIYTPPECNIPPFETDQSPVKPKKKKKKLLIAIMSVFLALAIIFGGVAVALINIPHVKVYRAFDNTLYNSSEYTIKFKISEDNGDYVKGTISMILGEDIDSSSIEIKATSRQTDDPFADSFDDLELDYDDPYDYYDGYDASYTNIRYAPVDYSDESYDESYEEPTAKTDEISVSIKEGKIRYNGKLVGNVEMILDIAQESLSSEFAIDLDFEETINNLLDNKINKDGFAEIIDGLIVPLFEMGMEEGAGKPIELPEFQKLSDDLTKLFLKDETAREAIAFEKVKSDLPGTTYEYDINIAKLTKAAISYASEDELYREFLELIAEEENADVDDMVEEALDELDDVEDMPEVTGKITVKSNRITNFTFESADAGTNFEISIESKK